jgi:hypothetical protein
MCWIVQRALLLSCPRQKHLRSPAWAWTRKHCKPKAFPLLLSNAFIVHSGSLFVSAAHHHPPTRPSLCPLQFKLILEPNIRRDCVHFSIVLFLDLRVYSLGMHEIMTEVTKHCPNSSMLVCYSAMCAHNTQRVDGVLCFVSTHSSWALFIPHLCPPLPSLCRLVRYGRRMQFYWKITIPMLISWHLQQVRMFFFRARTPLLSLPNLRREEGLFGDSRVPAICSVPLRPS